MNWIFEIYGSVYNAMLLQNRRPAASGPAAPAAASSPLLLHKLGQLSRKPLLQRFPPLIEDRRGLPRSAM
jgi:hypothetical protein